MPQLFLEQVDFIRQCPKILYIGDLDIEGLNRLATYIPQVESRYMNIQTFIDNDATNKPRLTNESLEALTDTERKLFDYLCQMEGFSCNNRLEHEFIKLADRLCDNWRLVLINIEINLSPIISL